MNLTGKELRAMNIITNVSDECVQMHGIDLELVKVESMHGVGQISKYWKTRLVKYSEVAKSLILVGNKGADKPIEAAGWQLNPGVYNVTFKQGCKIPSNQMLLIRQRSSLLRNGGSLHSSVFDAGFETDAIGTVMTIHHPIEIEEGARIAQIYAHKWNEVENLYTGQFQKDLQRKG